MNLRWDYLKKLAIFTAVYIASAQFGLLFFPIHNHVSLVWPAAGVSLALLVLFGEIYWPFIFIGDIISALLYPPPSYFWVTIGTAAANVAGTLVATQLLRRFADGAKFSQSLPTVLKFAVLPALVGPFVSAGLGIVVLILTGKIHWSLWLQNGWAWWFADTIGILVFTPASVAWFLSPVEPVPTRSKWEYISFWVTLVPVTGFVFNIFSTAESKTYPFVFAVFPFFCWAAIRFDRRVSVTIVPLVLILAVLLSAFGSGHLSLLAIHGSIVFVQVFIAISALTALVLTVVIAEKNETAERLWRSEQQYRNLVETSNDLIWSIDSEGRWTYVNQAARRIYGFEPEEMIGRSVVEFLLVEPNSHEQDLLPEILAGAQIEHWETVHRHKNGTHRTLLFNAVPLYDHQHQLIGATGTCTDLTDRKRAEAAYRESEARYQELFHTASDIVFTADKDGRCTSLNRAGEQITGYAAEEVTQMRFESFVVPEHLEIAREAFRDKLAGETSHTTYQLDILTKTGERVTLEVSTQIMRHRGKTVGIQGIARNITERINLEAQLRQAQKMEAIGQLAGGIAHDFNNLLTAIVGYTELILLRVDKGSALRRYASEIKGVCSRATSLVSQLLAFSRKQMLQPQVLDLNEVVERMTTLLRRVIGENIFLELDLDPELGKIKADPHQIEQVVLNLAVNARDAMPTGGVLKITTRNFEKEFNQATGDWSRNDLLVPAANLHVRLTLSDTGCGMPAEVKAKIFEPFFTTKDVGKGTGLGLSVVDGIVAQSGGFIEVESQVGAGTTFFVYLPRLTELDSGNVQDELKSESWSISGRSAKATILLVEDDLTVRSMARETLEMSGYLVVEAQDGLEALTVAEARPNEVDLVLTDVVMPRLSGPEFVRQLKVKHPHLRTLYVSGYVKSKEEELQLVADGSAFLHKPFTAKTLLQKISEVLGNGRVKG
ncbi:MAG: PAS domain S-box protein [Blastocatellia bacterium]|nr:PAS domain S-box protein [Blastocatellia bacterium]